MLFLRVGIAALPSILLATGQRSRSLPSELTPLCSEGRIMSIPTVADRCAQEVVRRYLEPILEAVFHPDSYGYRPGKSAIDAVRQARGKVVQTTGTSSICAASLSMNTAEE
jgi:hypothetical protein